MTGLLRTSAPIAMALVAGNVAAWILALSLFRGHPVLLGTAMLAYVLGLRHAVDADHIAAIDNVTRKLMQQGRRPMAVGLFFSLGHSSVVILASAAIAATSAELRGQIAGWREVGNLIGTSVSATFLFLIALANIVTLIGIWRALRAGRPKDATSLPRGVKSHILLPLMNFITQSWCMYPLGFLFGLGFDTASEIALLGISASQASQNLPLWSIMVFPLLFTAGMSLIDTLDGIIMTGAYGWALKQPRRKLTYNFTVTLTSVLVALVVGTLELLNLLAGKFSIRGDVRDWVAGLNEQFGMIGCAIILFFVLCWGASLLVHRHTDVATSDA